MPADLTAAARFLATHGRPLDRHRFAVRFEGADPARALAALDGYRNADGGYGWGLEPDLRTATSQPGAALHAFEVLEDIGPATSPRAIELADWLDRATLPDGGLPFALPIPDPAGCAPFWAGADPAASSLQITAIVATVALRVAAHDPALAAHPWLRRATSYCLDAIARLDRAPHALVLAFAVGLADAAHGHDPAAPDRLAQLGAFIPASGSMAVAGGSDGERMRPHDFAPLPGRPARALLPAGAVEASLEELAAGQQDDGGWRVDFASYSPAASLEWRGHMTVAALTLLRRNGLV